MQNPQSLLDEFALVVPGQVSAPTQVTVLFDAPGVSADSLGPNVQTRQSATNSNALNPETIVLALATVGMLLIALVAVGGFTVLAQRRLRSLGMLGALGATDRNIRLVVRVNGVLVGVIGALAGTVLGLAIWLAYRPTAEADAHHLIGTFAVPWNVVGPAIALAVVATYFAAARPARSITRIPVVAALSGRPAPPKQVHRSALPGVVLFVIAAALLSYSGKSNGNGGGGLELVLGIVLLIVAIILLAPFCLVVLARLGRQAPIAVRLALRDLVRYRARSGSALAAISLGVFIAALVCVLTAQRYGNVLDYAGPNLSQQPDHRVHAQRRPGPGQRPRRIQPIRDRRHAAGRGGGRPEHRQGPRLEHRHRTRPDQRLAAARRGRAVLVRTGVRGHAPAPAGLRDQGLRRQSRRGHPEHAARAVRPVRHAARLRRLLRLARRRVSPGNGGPGQRASQLPVPEGPVRGQPGDPGGRRAAVRHLGAQHGDHRTRHPHARPAHQPVQGWLIQAPHNPTAAQITNARLTAGAAGMTIETKSSTPSSAEILDYATAFGIALALGILAMSRRPHPQ